MKNKKQQILKLGQALKLTRGTPGPKPEGLLNPRPWNGKREV
jgi:hypothetical protein